MTRLLTRDDFREGVFSRDRHTCVLCGAPGQDAHHILERRLFKAEHEKGGYFLDNGATVCGPCHIRCETTDVSVEEVRAKAGIAKPVLPSHLYEDQVYDKWGNIIMPNGLRLRGELFYDESVQKVIAAHLHEFSNYVKFQRTWHLRWSPGMHKDDRMLDNMDGFQGERVIMSLKMDGQNTSCYSDYYVHARAIDGEDHESQHWVKQFWSARAGDLPEGWRVCAENLYAEHSIHYDDLQSYFLGFHVWNERNNCLDWDQTKEWFELLDIKPVTVLYDGIYDEKVIREIEKQIDFEKHEGYVLRVARSFSYGEYGRVVGKYVRSGHNKLQKHNFKAHAIVRNGLLESKHAP